MPEPRFLISRDDGGTALFEIVNGSLYQLETTDDDDQFEQGYYDAEMNFLGREPDTSIDKGDYPGHPFRGNQYTGGIPEEPGTTPIPEGHVRLYHQTSEEYFDQIEREGLLLSSARGIEGPKAIYADERGFYGKPSEKPTVEFHVPRERWDAPFVRTDSELDAGRVARENIVALHRPWHAHARYIEKNPEVLENVLRGEHDDLLTDRRYGQAIRYIKDKYRVTKREWDESKHPRGKTSEASTPGSFAPAGGASEFIEARGKSTRAGFLSPLDPSGLSGHKLYLNKEGTVGYALDPDNDIQNVFNNGGEKGAGGKALIDAIEKGGRTLDCYDGYLNDLYRQFGFHETGRMQFNDAFAPPGWDFDKHGRPDVVFMSWKGYDGGPEQSLARAKGKRDSWIKNERSTRYGNDWDAQKQRSRDEAKP